MSQMSMSAVGTRSATARRGNEGELRRFVSLVIGGWEQGSESLQLQSKELPVTSFQKNTECSVIATAGAMVAAAAMAKVGFRRQAGCRLSVHSFQCNSPHP